MRIDRQLWLDAQPALAFVIIIWVIWLVENISGANFSILGLYPRRAFGLLGILTTPLLHGGLEHIVSNTLAMFILPTIVLMSYPKSFIPLTVWLWLSTGFWTWCFAREAYHIGASGLVYGFASFIFFAGIFQRDRSRMALSFVIIFLYSGLLFGLIPDTGHISWESHLAGSIAGTGFAYFSRGWDNASKNSLPITIEESEDINTSDEISLDHIYYTKPGEKNSARIKLF